MQVHICSFYTSFSDNIPVYVLMSVQAIFLDLCLALRHTGRKNRVPGSAGFEYLAQGGTSEMITPPRMGLEPTIFLTQAQILFRVQTNNMSFITVSVS